MHSFTLETIFHEETRFSQLTYVIGTNSPKEKRLNGEGKSIFFWCHFQQDIKRPGTNKLNKHQWQNQNLIYWKCSLQTFSRGAFTVIWRHWMEDRCNYIVVGERNLNHLILILCYIRIKIRDLFWIGMEKISVRLLMWEGCTSFPHLKEMTNWSYQN